MTAESLDCTEAKSVTFRFCAPLHLLVAYEQGERTTGETFVEGLPPSKLRNLARRLTFVPAGHEYREWHEPGTHSRLMLFYFDPALLPTALGLRADDSKLAPRLLFEDLTLWHAAMKLNSLLEDASSADRPYFQALGTVLVYKLIRSSREQPAARQLRGGLAGWQQRNVTAYIEEHLTERIALATLAQLARLSRFHFSRAFKRSFGVSPQRYQSGRRIEYAKRLLANPDLSVTEVALQVGFGSSTSFAAAFRKAAGLNPSTYSRSL
jgi:AraC family transcriptional regulator